MDRSALVAGGTGGLGSAVTAKLLEDGWRVVVPWIAEHEIERLDAHPGLELVKADSTTQAALPLLVEAGGCRRKRWQT